LSVGAVLVAVCVWGCGEPDPKVPGGSSATDPDQWFVFDLTVPDRDPRDLVARFQESAHARGCNTERLGQHWHHMAGGSAAHLYSAVEARCDDGVIRIAPLQGGVRIACAQPTSQERCDGLLREISDAR
jgi:hypothetical protein